jgi:high-affinity iron transporter
MAMTARGRWAAAAALLWALAAPSAGVQAAPSADPPEARRDPVHVALHMLDYVAVDYPGAVADGKVLDQGEYDEQLEFVTQVRATLAERRGRREGEALLARADRLVGLVRDRRPGAEVAALATELAGAVVRAWGVEVAPRRPPDLHAGAALYAAQCAACHGAEGRGDGPAGASLDPRPASFHDRARLAQRSVFGLYSTITLGVENTGMTAYRALSEDQRWALAFHVASLATPRAQLERGQELWRRGRSRSEVPDLAALATRTEREALERGGEDAVALLAYLRTQPALLAAGGEAPLARCVRLLRESLDAYRAGKAGEAQALAQAAYLDGFELVEPSLDAVNRPLRLRVEEAMQRYRTLLRDGAAADRVPADRVEAELAAVLELVAAAREHLDTGGLAPAEAFAGALIIVLREGLEALLVVAAIVALLVRAGRRDALPWIHVGWIGALVLGGITWAATSWVVAISGATREMTEGVSALVAAAILLYVGFWMHGRTAAARWQAYLRERLAGALAGRTILALAAVSFLAVYREAFETVLFAQSLLAQAGPEGRGAALGGLGTAALILAALAWLVVRGGVRLPLGAFFGATSLLLAALAVVLAGKGVAALQEAGWLPARVLHLPALPALGIYPSIEGIAAQAAMVVAIAAVFALGHRRERAA